MSGLCVLCLDSSVRILCRYFMFVLLMVYYVVLAFVSGMGSLGVCCLLVSGMFCDLLSIPVLCVLFCVFHIPSSLSAYLSLFLSAIVCGVGSNH